MAKYARLVGSAEFGAVTDQELQELQSTDEANWHKRLYDAMGYSSAKELKPTL